MESNIPSPQPRQLLLLRLLVVAGVVALGVFLRWMILAAIVSPLWITGLLLLSAAYFSIQIAANWIVYWHAARNTSPPLTGRVTVDVFLTVYNEDHELIRAGLTAAVAMRGDHTTWLLDDGASPALAKMAQSLGARYLTRPDRVNAKAGNLNWALERTSGDVIAVFDIDHIPKREFLERSVGHFDDPGVGFVQVMLTFSNEDASWIARAAAESSLDFYNATSLGMDAMGSATMMGSNSIIRRSALESINGYRPGLAEDLATSIALHSAGWRSCYVAEPLAPGMAPPDLAAWFIQQLKWARGVFEVLLNDFPRLFRFLTPAQRLCYSIRMTKYWVGPFVAGHLIVTFILLWVDSPVATNVFNQYVLHLMPFVAADFAIRYLAMQLWCLDKDRSKSLRRAVMLVYSSFPVYALAWIMALVRVPLAFRATPKGMSGRLSNTWRIPIVAAMLAFDSGLIYAISRGELTRHPYFILFASLETIPIMVMFYHSLRLKPLLDRNRSPFVHDGDERKVDEPDAKLSHVRFP